MDEKFVEAGEATQEAMKAERIVANRAAAIPDEDVPSEKQTWHCIEEDCGIELPELRRVRGRKRCVECETAQENKRKRGF